VTRGKGDGQAAAKLMVLVVALAWGLNWVAARVILTVLPPWTLRAVGIGLGMLTLFAAASIIGVRLMIPRAQAAKIFVAGLFNVAIFNVCSAYAQVYGTTSRAIVIAYSMPIWTALLARLLLKEKLTVVKLLALALCATGLVVLIFPLMRTGFPLGALLALGCAWSWAAGTIYMKWAQIQVPMLAAAAWQLLFGWLILGAGMLYFDGLPQLSSLPAPVVGWIAYNGLLGMGLAYFLWFVVVDRLPATTATLGILLSPVVGVVGSTLIVGERPDLHDVIGFALIFSAAASVLLQPNAKHIELPE